MVVSAQTNPTDWIIKFEKGDFDTLEHTLDSIIDNTDASQKYIALKILGDIYKIKGDIICASLYNFEYY